MEIEAEHPLDTLEFVPYRYKTQEMCIKAVDDYANALEFVPDRYKTQGMCNKVVSENSFLLKYSHDNIRLKKYVIKSLMFLSIKICSRLVFYK